MIILACETSTLLGSVAIVQDEKILVEKQLLRQGSHSEILNELIQQCLLDTKLKLENIDCFAAGIGPGSFTGLRISLNTVKTFGYIHHKPVCGFNSLLNLAFANQNQIQMLNQCQRITPMINAYKNMVYIAEYALENNALIETKEPQVVRVQELNQFITENSWVIGDGYTTYEKYLPEQIRSKCFRHELLTEHPTAGNLGLIANLQSNKICQKSWHDLLPLYLRSSEAEEVLAGIKYQAL
jgi:tRNA threonylcarbamoyl adenosine modification protein YeaZ